MISSSTGDLSIDGRALGLTTSAATTLRIDGGRVAFSGLGAGLSVAATEGRLVLDKATGTLSATPTASGLAVTVALTSAEVIGISAPSLSGTGPFSLPVSVTAASEQPISVTAIAPRGWTLQATPMGFEVRPPIAAADGRYSLTLVAQTADGAGRPRPLAQREVVIDLRSPSSATASLALVDDPTFAVETLGLRLPALIAELSHEGPAQGRYDLAVDVSPPSFVASLARTSTVVSPRETRRLGLTLRLPDGAQHWPACGTSYTVTVTASGAATALATLTREVPCRAAFSFDTKTLAPVVLTPGESGALGIAVRSTGNVAAIPALEVRADQGLDAALVGAVSPLAPGTSGVAELVVTAPFTERLPREYRVRVGLAADAFDRARGLVPSSVVVRVLVAEPRDVARMQLIADATELGDLELLEALAPLGPALIDPCAGGTGGAPDSVLAPMRAFAELLAPRDPTVAARFSAIANALAADCSAEIDWAAAFDTLRGFLEAPDLVTALIAPASTNNGEALDGVVRIVNQGRAASPATELVVRLRRGPAVVFVESVAVPALEPRAAFERPLNIATDTLLGRYVLDAEADPGRAIVDRDPGNGRASRLVEVLPRGSAPEGNRPPTFLTTSLPRVESQTALALPVSVEDPDGDLVFVELIAGPRGLRLDVGSATLVGAVAAPQSAVVELLARDVYGASRRLQVPLEVVMPGELGTAPRFLSTPATRRLVAGMAWSHPIVLVDEDGDEISLMVAGPTGLALTGPLERTLAWTPDEAALGPHLVTLTATDAGGLVSTQRFWLEVASEPRPFDRAITSVIQTAPQEAQVSVSNLGDASAPAGILRVYDDRAGDLRFGSGDVLRGQAVLGPLTPGQTATVTIALSGESAFLGAPLFAELTEGDSVPANDVGSTLGRDEPAAFAYPFYRPFAEVGLTLVGGLEDTRWSLIDAQTGASLAQGVVVAAGVEPLDLEEALPAEGVIIADRPLTIHMGYEVFNPDFAGDIYHPDVDGSRLGTEFIAWLPAVTPNNRLLVTALEDGVVTLSLVGQPPLHVEAVARGQVWEPSGLASEDLLHIQSTAVVMVHSASVTGMSVVPPADFALAMRSDVGRRFRFDTRSRGQGGGALAIIGYGPGAFSASNAAGLVIAEGELERGEVAFVAGVGEVRGGRLAATGPVSLLAGDLATAGADRLGLMGEDFSMLVGAGGVELVVPTLSQTLGDTVLLNGPSAAIVKVGAEAPRVVAPFGKVVLSDDRVVEVTSTAPLVAQIQGGGDRAFDLGTTLTAVAPPDALAKAVLDRVHIDTGRCRETVAATVRIGNAGRAPLPESFEVQLIAVTAGGLEVLDSRAVGVALGAGHFVDMTLRGAAPDGVASFSVRGVDPGGDLVGEANPAQPRVARCSNRAPRFTTTPGTSVARGTTYGYLAAAEDPEGDSVGFALVSGPPGARIEAASGALSWRPAAGTRTGDFILEVSDPFGAFDLQSFRVVVVDPCEGGIDSDGDGLCDARDCAPTDATRPRAEVIGNGIDDDCDPATPDLVTPGAVTLTVAADRQVYGAHDEVRLVHLVTSENRVFTLSGLTISTELRCPQRVSLPGATLDPLPPLARTSHVGRWRPTMVAGTCDATAEVRAGIAVVATASTRFEVVSGLRGEVVAMPAIVAAGEGTTLRWRVENPERVGQDFVGELRVVGALGRIAPLATRTLGPGERIAGEAPLDTTGFSPGIHRVELWHAEQRLAVTTLRVTGESRLVLWPGDPGSPLVFDPGRPSVALGYRPLGERAGDSPLAARLSGVWAVGGLRLRVEFEDALTDAGDLVEFAIQGRDMDTVVNVRAGRGELVDGLLGEPTFTRSERGEVVVEVGVAAGALAPLTLEPGVEIRMSVVVRDGEVRAPRELIAFADDWDPQTLRPVPGTLVLVDEPPPVGPDPGPEVAPEAGPEGGQEEGPEVQTGAEVGIEAESEALTASGGGCACESGGAPGDAGAMTGVLLVLTLLGLRARARRDRSRLGALLALTMVAASGAVGGAGCGGDDDGRNLGTDTRPGDAEAVDPADLDAAGDAARPETGDDADDDAGLDPDTGGGDGVGPDADAGAGEDVVMPGRLGDPCERDGDCATGLCLAGVGYAICSATCEVYGCPELWTCAPFPGGVGVCVPANACIDRDGDGYGHGRGCLGPDCDDEDATRHPGRAEECNGRDDDCDGEVDEGVKNACERCGPLPVEVCNGQDDDCDGETDEGVDNPCGGCGPVPGEVCNGRDDDCDGEVDEGLPCAPCPDGETVACFAAPAERLGVGECRAGLSTCRGGGFGACVGAVLPTAETCNGLDDDCDGLTDEGLINACGTCGPAPDEVCNGLDDDCDGSTDEGVLSPCGGCTPCGQVVLFPGESGSLDIATAPAPDGAITLGSGRSTYHYIWVPNSAENSVSRWDTRTGREMSRYYIGADPSRTAIDLDGHAWVGHRGDGLLTNIRSDLRSCADRNGNGVIDTSRDFNGDGAITFGEVVNTLADPLLDECVHCQIRLGTPNDLVRGVAVDRNNKVWAGTWISRQIFRIDPATCDIELALPTNVFGHWMSTYGLAVGGDGMLWNSSFNDPCVLKIDTELGAIVDRICDGSFTRYGIAIDGRNRPWYADLGSGVAVLDPATRTFTRYGDPTNVLRATTGIVVDTDGGVWLAGYDSNQIARFDSVSGAWDLFSVNAVPAGFLPQFHPRGVVIDSDGFVWAISLSSSGLTKMTRGGQVVGSYRVTAAKNPAAGTSPYSYSDNTGYQLFNFTATRGTWQHRYDAGRGVRLTRLVAHAFLPEPVGTTSLRFEVRAAAIAAGLEGLEWVALPEAALSFELAEVFPEPVRFVDVKVTLETTDARKRPVLRDVVLLYETADCRAAEVGCGADEVCDPVFGGCVRVPTNCASDEACPLNSYCDATGRCRVGCRTSLPFGLACDGGLACDPGTRTCISRGRECAADVDCPSGRFCRDAACEEGCRVTPDSCALGARCNAATRICEAAPPECAGDEDCPDDRYCSDFGTCATGCRSGGCAAGEVCRSGTRTCGAAPPSCNPANPGPEVCNGRDDDCDGEIDDGLTAGATCTVGSGLASGREVCHRGAILCQVDVDASGEPVVLAGTIQNALLAHGRFSIPANASFRDVLVVRDGATLKSDGRRLTTIAAFTLEIERATIDGVHLVFNHAGRADILESELIGVVGADSQLDCNGAATLRLLGVRTVDLGLLVRADCKASVEQSRLEQRSLDAVERWALSVYGEAVVDRTEMSGRNVLPRRSRGVRVLGAGRLAMQRSSVAWMVDGLHFDGTGPSTVTTTTLVSNDAAVRIRNAASPALSGVVVDDSDVGHVGVGLWLDTLSAAAAPIITGTAFRMDALDTAVVLDPDVFQAGSGLVLSGSRFEGSLALDHAYALEGLSQGGELVIGLIDAATRYVVSATLRLRAHPSVALVPGLILTVRDPTLPNPPLRTLQLEAGTVLTGHDVVMRDVVLDIDATSSLSIEGFEWSTHATASERTFASVSGSATFLDATLWSTARPTGNSRLHVGFNVSGDGRLACVGCVFDTLRAPIYAQQRSQVAASMSTFRNSAVALWAVHTSTLGPVREVLIEDLDATLVSTGIRLNHSEGGRADLDRIAFRLGAEDTPLTFNANAFRTATPTVFGVELVDADGAPIALVMNGGASGGSLTIPASPFGPWPIEGVADFHGGAVVSVASGAAFVGYGGGDDRIRIYDPGSRVEFGEGVRFEDMRVEVFAGASASFAGTRFLATNTVGRQFLWTTGDITCDRCRFEGFGKTQIGLMVFAPGSAELDASVFSNLRYGQVTHSGARTRDRDSVFVDVVEAADLLGTGDLELHRPRFHDTSPARSYGVFATGASGPGQRLRVIDAHFDVGPEDEPFRWDLWVFREGSDVAVSGTTWARGERGRGQVLIGDAPDGATMVIGRIDPSEGSYTVDSTLTVRGTSRLTLLDGISLVSPNTNRYILDVRGSATLNAGAASLVNIRPWLRESSVSTFAGTSLSSTATSYEGIFTIHGSPSVTIEGAWIRGVTLPSGRIVGIYIEAGGAQVAVSGTRFEQLDIGIQTVAGNLTLGSGNTFVNVTTPTTP